LADFSVLSEKLTTAPGRLPARRLDRLMEVALRQMQSSACGHTVDPSIYPTKRKLDMFSIVSKSFIKEPNSPIERANGHRRTQRKVDV
jgi:hypothetical protein